MWVITIALKNTRKIPQIKKKIKKRQLRNTDFVIFVVAVALLLRFGKTPLNFMQEDDHGYLGRGEDCSLGTPSLTPHRASHHF